MTDNPLNDRVAFERFHAEHPMQRITYEGREWPYLALGEGPHVMLSLTGVLGLPQFGWYTLRLYAPRMRVIAPAYNNAPTMSALCDGIAAILEAEGVGQVDVKGGSYGGFVAQVFVRRHTERVRRLILSHTAPPQPERVPRARLMAFALRFVPDALVKRGFKRRFEGTVPQQFSLIREHYHALVDDHITRRSARATYQRLIDYDQRDFTPGEWGGPTLILTSNNDPTVPPEQQQALHTLYPQARVVTFRGTGHSTALLATADYVREVIGFIES